MREKPARVVFDSPFAAIWPIGSEYASLPYTFTGLPTMVVAVVSGGLDSVVMAYLLSSRGCFVHVVSFDYGQRHKRELAFARTAAHNLGFPHHIVDLTSITKLLSGSALTDSSVAVPHGHYTDETMKATIVPNRNAIMLSVAFGVAAAEYSDGVAIAVHSGDHAIYPDCRPLFASRFQMMETAALEGVGDPRLRLITPFINFSKTDIVCLGQDLKVPFELTWSCYEGGKHHCGRCGTCVERRLAFEEAKVPDPTRYTG